MRQSCGDMDAVPSFNTMDFHYSNQVSIDFVELMFLNLF